MPPLRGLRPRAAPYPAAQPLPREQPPERPGSMDWIASQLAWWIESTASAVAGALAGTEGSPFSARASQGELAEYYATTLWGRDGRPNAQGWLATYHRTGA